MTFVSVLTFVVNAAMITAGIGLVVTVALQVSRTEGLGSVLAGGGGGGGKVGREANLASASRVLAYAWLAMAMLLAWLKH